MNIFDLDKGRIDLCFIVPRFTKDRSLTIIHLIKEYHLVQKANVWNVRMNLIGGILSRSENIRIIPIKSNINFGEHQIHRLVIHLEFKTKISNKNNNQCLVGIELSK